MKIPSRIFSFTPAIAMLALHALWYRSIIADIAAAGSQAVLQFNLFLGVFNTTAPTALWWLWGVEVVLALAFLILGIRFRHQHATVISLSFGLAWIILFFTLIPFSLWLGNR